MKISHLLVVLCFAFGAAAQNGQPSVARTSATVSTAVESPQHQAWALLSSGTRQDSAARRASAVSALALMKGDKRAINSAIRALGDGKAEVRVAAALTLGELHAKSAIPNLEAAVSDSEPTVVIAAAHSLVLLKDKRAYEIYYQILTGERKGTKGLVAGELDTLKDPKKAALLGFQEGIGFVPFAGMGYEAFKAILKDDSSPIRAAAAKVMADDCDAKTEAALVDAAVHDKSALVRAAALDALARHGDPTVIAQIAPAMSDDKPSVRYVAAAAVLHLNDASHAKRTARN